ncbi:SGNH/GDSL hydrolase family protein [Nostoc sp. LEGE 06077]|uniref:SGNH/GDSL hydrolase family protein n=1 Tax=Nostoc sp. LEGE 06077 TaxID=915325 RepID=UPI0018820203|nr:SGNH/GDSL hydrolase family protein [Nostoc sp. LEGE 06077]MBE9208813.1 SGNH/GDSL hydrolase family protein [Nostoc sp. LEGE 06077]
MKKRLVAAGFVFLSFMLPQKASAANFSQLYVFGDSLSDTGNVFNATGGVFPPTTSYFNGRLSNGPLWVEYFGNQLGLQPTLATTLNTTIPTQGINFAFGGAASGVGNAVVRDAPLPGVLEQVGLFAQPLLANNQTADPNALYVVWGGANDFLFPNPEDLTTPVNNIGLALTTLASVGARNILVFNLPDLGKLPGSTVDNRDPVTLTQSTNNFNFGLQTTVAALNQNLNLNIIPVDVNSLFNRAIASPSEFGLNNVTKACLLTVNCLNNQNQFLFWDNFHPTTTAHRFIAETALAAIRSQQVPEPSDALGLLALGALGVAGMLKRQQQKSAFNPTNQVLDAQSSRIKVES